MPRGPHLGLRERVARTRRIALESLEARALLAGAVSGEVLRLSPSYLENLGVVESAFIERVRNADRNQDDRVTTRDVLYSMEDREQFYETLGVIQDWREEISKDIAQRLYSLDPARWTSLGEPTGDPPGEGGGMPPPGGGVPGGATGTGGNANFPGAADSYVSYDAYSLERWGYAPGPDSSLYSQYAWDIDLATIDLNVASGVQVDSRDKGWLMANLDDDDYSHGDTASDAGQTDALGNPVVAAYEDDFLPFVIRKRVAIGQPTQPFDAVFRLVFNEDSNIRVWRQLTAETEFAPATWQRIHSMQTIGYVDFNHLLFVEAVGIMDMSEPQYDQIELYVQPVDAIGVPTSQTQMPVDRITVGTATASGPTAVPWGGKYEYHAAGGERGEIGWDTPIQGTTKAIATDFHLPPLPVPHSKITVQWDKAKAVMGSVVYIPYTGYKWKALEVAVVEVSVDLKNLQDLSQVRQYLAGAMSDRNHFLTSRLTPLSNWRGTAAIMAEVQGEIIQPTDNGIERGREYINAGFVQNITVLAWQGLYDDGDGHTWKRRKAIEHDKKFLDTGNPPLTPWTQPVGVVKDIPKGDGAFSYNVRFLDGPEYPIVRSDQLTDTRDSATADIGFADLVWSFDLYFAVSTTQVSDAFWANEHGNWVVDGSGEMEAGTHIWTSEDYGNSVFVVPDGFRSVPAGTEVPVTTGPTFNQVANVDDTWNQIP